MEIRVIESSDGLRRLALSGRLDLAGTDAIETRFAALTAGTRQTAIVDLREVTFLASLGMRMLVSSARTLLRSGAKLVLLGPQPAVRLAGLQLRRLPAPSQIKNPQRAGSSSSSLASKAHHADCEPFP
jgi:anti-anti-sigma factor